jgi:hypothetical protein
LIARRWETVGYRHLRALQIGLAASALLALLAAQADFQLAVAVRRSAQEAVAKCSQSQGTVWFEGHWGFQYYMQKFGALAADFKQPRQRPGDIVIIPQHNTDVTQPPAENVLRRDTLQSPNASWVSTWQGDVGAGFYSAVVGPLPFGFGRMPPERVFLFELKAADAK